MNVKLSEAQTRELIDEQLRKVGWNADTDEIRYSKGVRPVKGRNLAIAEWPTDSKTGNSGYADYALFIGEKMLGIIEAKKKHTNISSVLDGQCKEYARMIKAEHEKYVLKQYGEYKVPFLFATNGRDYIKQYEEMSGIWFLDTRQQFNTSKALAGWPSPEGLEQDLERDIAEADRKLAATGYELLEDSNGLRLRYYQVEAVKAAEKAIAEHKNTVLLAKFRIDFFWKVWHPKVTILGKVCYQFRILRVVLELAVIFHFLCLLHSIRVYLDNTDSI